MKVPCRKALLALALPLVLGACALLEAEAPLFAVADQAPEFAAAEGLWVARDGACAANPVTLKPGDDSCLEWMRVARVDGAWTLEEPGGDPEEAIRALVMRAAPRGSKIAGPLYVAEVVNAAGDEINYAAVVPREVRDGRVTRFTARAVSCDVVTGEWGAIDGIVVTRGEGERIVRCVVQAKPAVIEAARRTAIDALPEIDDNELVFVRPE